MPTNKSENKVRVTKFFGGGGLLGFCPPLVGQVTCYGTIIGLDTGNLQVTVSGAGVGLPTKFYPHQLFVTDTVATSTAAWPTGVGCVKSGHAALVPNVGVGSGTAFDDGSDTIKVFGR